jgi:hypothetical protein
LSQKNTGTPNAWLPPLLKALLHELGEHRVADQLAAPRSCPARGGQALRGERPVVPAGRVQVAAQLTADRGRAATGGSGDGPHPQPAWRRSAIPTRSSSDKNRDEIAH